MRRAAAAVAVRCERCERCEFLRGRVVWPGNAAAVRCLTLKRLCDCESD
jgi:hypothetical protein